MQSRELKRGTEFQGKQLRCRWGGGKPGIFQRLNVFLRRARRRGEARPQGESTGKRENGGNLWGELTMGTPQEDLGRFRSYTSQEREGTLERDVQMR